MIYVGDPLPSQNLLHFSVEKKIACHDKVFLLFPQDINCLVTPMSLASHQLTPLNLLTALIHNMFRCAAGDEVPKSKLFYVSTSAQASTLSTVSAVFAL